MLLNLMLHLQLKYVEKSDAIRSKLNDEIFQKQRPPTTNG